ncbi:MAG: hypothetical protein M1823_005185 [Watsoniomyces obsoletus]|nr:MAG: hypothetical protein M1823_005185 [Watsoniomyces obsoletus]
MLSSLLRPPKRRVPDERSSLLASSSYRKTSSQAAPESAEEGRSGAFDVKDDEDENEEFEDADPDNEGAARGGAGPDDERDEEDVDEDDEVTPLLPIFSAAHLDALPVYEMTHAIRMLVQNRCETSLTWDQLRSPQVSQFLIKPIQQRIRTSHFSRATLYALMANCLQFVKEAYTDPGNSGTSRTRALVCELLAIKLLKEFTARELIDALSYDFYPLQGSSQVAGAPATPTPYLEGPPKAWAQPRVGRVSALEVAIRAQAKRFLAHALVVQHLQAIWAGTIVFHSAADNLHRAPSTPVPAQQSNYGALSALKRALLASSHAAERGLRPERHEPIPVRRSVTLYDPRDASLFKLSRLRVPRYRNALSTCSFAVLLALYLMVLIRHSMEITAVEVLFWFWSAGFMLDELVGFNEQGFSLYIMSFWNTFDLGILLLLIVYYTLRLYGIIMSENGRHAAAEMAYDVLGATAVFLFPRLFSVLDHYRYFSQLLVAFRLMAVDLAAIFILIIISCSGFFVAFTLSFGNDDDNASSVAYSLFQMIFGFTPAAWNVWGKYNLLGKAILTLFLFITHFLTVTIMITVLTNSFMAIVANANEEHQFIFAVNTISMVKSDALFSYIAPTNILAWLLTPLRFVMPFRSFVKLNRTVIKLTHFPVLFAIYCYERLVLLTMTFEPTDLVHRRGRPRHPRSTQDPPVVTLGLFGATMRMRQESRAGLQTDRALEEVFRRPFKGDSMRDPRPSQERRQTSTVVNTWMREVPDGRASPPLEQDRLVVDRLEGGLLRPRRPRLGQRRTTSRTRDFTDVTRSAVSDPEEFVSNPKARVDEDRGGIDSELQDMSIDEEVEQTGADGDDESAVNDDADGAPHLSPVQARTGTQQRQQDRNQQSTPRRESRRKASIRSRVTSPTSPAAASPNDEIRHSPSRAVSRPLRYGHGRNVSSATILYNPVQRLNDESSLSPPKRLHSARRTPTGSGGTTPRALGRRSPRKDIPAASRPQPIARPRSDFPSARSLVGLGRIEQRSRLTHRSSSLVLDFSSNLGHGDDGDEENDEFPAGNALGAVPSSFATQMAIATGAVRARRGGSGGDSQMMGRLMLARMQTLEEGFKELLREVKQLRPEDEQDNDEPHAASRSKKTTRKRRHHRSNNAPTSTGTTEISAQALEPGPPSKSVAESESTAFTQD